MAEKETIRLSGTSIAPGLAMGRAFVYQDILDQDLRMYDVRPDQIETECQRIHRAAQEVQEDLQDAARRVAQQIGAYQ